MTIPPADAIYLFLLGTSTVVGNLGNTMVIGAVLSDKNLRSKQGNMFIMNLAVADLCVTAFVDPFSIVGVFKGLPFWQKNDVLCHFIGSVCLISCVCSMWTIAAISFNRYILLCKNHLYKRIFTRKYTMIIILIMWFGPLLLDLPNFFDWGGHAYDLKTMSCAYDRTASYSYTVFCTTMFVAVPLLLVLFCNIKIYSVVMQSKQRIAAHTNKHGLDDGRISGAGSTNFTYGASSDCTSTTKATVVATTPPSQNDKNQNVELKRTLDENTLPILMPITANAGDAKTFLAMPNVTNEQRKPTKAKLNFRQEVKLAKTLFLVFIIFGVSWAPYALLCLIDRYDVVYKEVYTYAIFMAHSSSSMNSILYAATNKSFRNGYKLFLAKMGCRFWRTP